MNGDYLNELRARSGVFRSTRLKKLLRAPARMISSKALEKISRAMNHPVRVRARTFWGEKMTVVFPERVSVSLFQYGFFEAGLTAMIIRHLKPGMVFFDVGAHFGYFTLLASKLVGRAGQVHAFDPTPSTFDVLELNVRERSNVHANNVAVYSQDAILSLTDYGDTFSAWNTIANGRLDAEAKATVAVKQYDVHAISIDAYVEEKRVEPNFVKIDAEGAERHILEGMVKTMRAVRPLISLEVGGDGSGGDSSSREVVQYLLDKGYQVFEWRGEDIVKHHVQDRYTHDNLLFIPG